MYVCTYVCMYVHYTLQNKIHQNYLLIVNDVPRPANFNAFRKYKNYVHENNSVYVSNNDSVLVTVSVYC